MCSILYVVLRNKFSRNFLRLCNNEFLLNITKIVTLPSLTRSPILTASKAFKNEIESSAMHPCHPTKYPDQSSWVSQSSIRPRPNFRAVVSNLAFPLLGPISPWNFVSFSQSASEYLEIRRSQFWLPPHPKHGVNSRKFEFKKFYFNLIKKIKVA